MYRLLVTGNGFDKACGMTTDFKDFIEYIKKIRRKNQQNISIDIGSIDSLLFNLCLTDNCLFDWLLNQAHFIDTWMCLEEILEETIFFIDDLLNEKEVIEVDNSNKRYLCFLEIYMKCRNITQETEIDHILNISNKNNTNPNPNKTVIENKFYKNNDLGENMTKLIDKLEIDLNKMNFCLEYYLSMVVKNSNSIQVPLDFNNIDKYDAIINFNYTNNRILNSLTEKLSDIVHIHGKTREDIDDKIEFTIKKIKNYSNDKRLCHEYDYNEVIKYIEQKSNDYKICNYKYLCNLMDLINDNDEDKIYISLKAILDERLKVEGQYFDSNKINIINDKYNNINTYNDVLNLFKKGIYITNDNIASFVNNFQSSLSLLDIINSIPYKEKCLWDEFILKIIWNDTDLLEDIQNYISDNNLILGIDHDIKKFNDINRKELKQFSKYLQCHIKFDHIPDISSFNSNSDKIIDIYGHSLSILDSYILEEILKWDNTKINIFCYNKDDKKQKVLNIQELLNNPKVIPKNIKFQFVKR